MGLITSPVPEIGSPNASEQVDTTNLLTEIKNLLNGSLDAANLSVALRDAASPPVVSALPSSPTDGARVRYRAADGVLWPLRFNSGSSSIYKWEAEGLGGPLVVASSASGVIQPYTMASAVSLTLPFAGEYYVSASADLGGGDPDGMFSFYVQDSQGTVQLFEQLRQTAGARVQVVEQPFLRANAGTQTLMLYRELAGAVLRSQFAVKPKRVG